MREFLGLGGILLRSPDAERLRVFYEQALGFVFDADGGGGWECQVGHAHFGIRKLLPGEAMAPLIYTWSVSDLDQLVARLHRVGIDVSPSSGDFWAFMDHHQSFAFGDPDGNHVVIQAVGRESTADDEWRSLTRCFTTVFGPDPRIAERLATLDPRALVNAQRQRWAIQIWSRRLTLDEALDEVTRIFSWEHTK